MPFPAEAQHLRWSRLIALGDNAAMHRTMGDEVFPFLRALGDNVAGEVTTYGGHMRDARYTIPNAAPLGKVVDMLDHSAASDFMTSSFLVAAAAARPCASVSSAGAPASTDL